MMFLRKNAFDGIRPASLHGVDRGNFETQRRRDAETQRRGERREMRGQKLCVLSASAFLSFTQSTASLNSAESSYAQPVFIQLSMNDGEDWKDESEQLRSPPPLTSRRRQCDKASKEENLKRGAAENAERCAVKNSASSPPLRFYPLHNRRRA